jgi:hypothetical protein
MMFAMYNNIDYGPTFSFDLVLCSPNDRNLFNQGLICQIIKNQIRKIRKNFTEKNMKYSNHERLRLPNINIYI